MKHTSTMRPPTPEQLELTCPTCGKELAPSSAEIRHVVNGEPQLVAGIAHLACVGCGEVLVPLQGANALQQRAVAAYREAHGLLDSQQIRELREKLGMTQAQLAQVLQLGQNTLSRWESGRAAQSGAMDVLLRLVRDVPGTEQFLRKRAA